MQHDEHVWAWRWQRFYKTGFMIGMVEIGAAGPAYHYIDPSEYFLTASRI